MRQMMLFKRSVDLEWILLFAIIIAGVFLRLEAQSHLRVISPDGVVYINRVSSVLEGQGRFERRGPFFQLLLMISYKIFGVNFESSILVPQFFGSIVPILLFFLGKRFFNSETGLVAALLGSLNPMLINLSCWVLRETLSLALILMLMFTAHITLGARSKRRRLLATFLPGFLSGLIILTREEMPFIIPPAYIAYIYFHEKRRRDSIMRICIFLIATIFTVTPWLLYSSLYFGDPFYSYAYYINAFISRLGSTPVSGATSGTPVLRPVSLVSILLGIWGEVTALPSIFSLLGFVFLPIGILFTIRRRATWIVYLVMGFNLLLFALIIRDSVPYQLMLFPYGWVDTSRIIFSGTMPGNVIAAYGIVRLTSLLSKER